MNRDKWNSLSAANQKVIEQINREWMIKHGEAWDSSDAEGIVFFLNRGSQIIGLDAKEAARWKKAVAPIIEEYVKKTDGKGLPGREIVDFTIQTLNRLQ